VDGPQRVRVGCTLYEGRERLRRLLLVVFHHDKTGSGERGEMRRRKFMTDFEILEIEWAFGFEPAPHFRFS
jgi:hypothetical protein